MFVEKKITELKPHPMNELFFDDIEGEKWEEFLRSVQIQGIMHPLAITEDGTVIAGHQRLRACFALNIDTVKCDVWPPMSDDQIIWCMITSNIRQRGSINSPSIKLGRMLMELERIEKAEPLFTKQEGVCGHQTVRKHLGIDKKVAQHSKAIAKMPEEMQELVEQESISPRTAYDIICKLTPEEQVELAKKLDPVQKYTQAAIKAAIEQFFPKAKEVDELQKKLAEDQQNDNELELRERLREAQANERKVYEEYQAERKQRKKDRAEFEKRMDAMEQLLDEQGGDSAEIARLTEERDQYMKDADTAQVDADLQLVIGLATAMSSALSEVANDPRPLTGSLVGTASGVITMLENKLDAIKARISLEAAS